MANVLTFEEEKSILGLSGFEKEPEGEFDCLVECYSHSLLRDVTIFVNKGNTVRVPDDDRVWGNHRTTGTLIDVLKDTLEEVEDAECAENNKVGDDSVLVETILDVLDVPAHIDHEFSEDTLLEEVGYFLTETTKISSESLQKWEADGLPTLFCEVDGAGNTVWRTHGDNGVRFKSLGPAIKMVAAMVVHTLRTCERKRCLYNYVAVGIRSGIRSYEIWGRTEE